MEQNRCNIDEEDKTEKADVHSGSLRARAGRHTNLLRTKTHKAEHIEWKNENTAGGWKNDGTARQPSGYIDASAKTEGK